MTALQAALRGAVAGVIAAEATRLFQIGWAAAKLPPTDHPPMAQPPPEIVADRAAELVTGRRWPDASRPLAGQVIHYATGAAMGIGYSLLARRWAGVGKAHGVAYGLGAWVVVEEAGLTVLGIRPPPWRIEAAEHVFAAASHVIFGAALNAAINALNSDISVTTKY